MDNSEFINGCAAILRGLNANARGEVLCAALDQFEKEHAINKTTNFVANQTRRAQEQLAAYIESHLPRELRELLAARDRAGDSETLAQIDVRLKIAWQKLTNEAICTL